MSQEGYVCFGRPNIEPEDIEAVVEILRSGWIGTGPRAKEFEQRFGRLFVLEDAAHAIEAWYRGRKVGTFGAASCFSNLTTIEGGMLCTDDEKIANQARILALHGMSADGWARFAVGETRR